MSHIVSLPPDLVIHDAIAQSTFPGSWDMDMLKDDLKAIWDQGITGKGVRIANNDTGVDKSHRYCPTPVFEWSAFGGDTTDRHGHGTWTALRHSGLSIDGFGPGIAPESELMVFKVLNDQGSGSTAGIAQARRIADREGADIINESLGGGSADPDSRDSIENAKHVKIDCCSAGNAGYNGSNTIGYPAKYLEAWCNGSFKRNFDVSNFSSGGRQLDDATPGEQVVSGAPGGGWNRWSGTSMSAPFRSGLFALEIHKMRRVGLPVPQGAEAWRKWYEAKGFYKDLHSPGQDVRTGLGYPLIKKIIAWLKDPNWL